MIAGPGGEPDEPDRNARLVASERQQLKGVAYRLLGSLSEAEDAVQEAFARWFTLSETERAAIASPGAWLNTVTSRICLNQLASARVRRENYVGEWIPEPLPERAEWITGGLNATTLDPGDRVTLDDSISMAFLVLLESMTPPERVSFILHDIFGYPFPEIAAIVGRTPAACRQLAVSARRRIPAPEESPTTRGRRTEIVRDFNRAWQERDVDTLIRLLDPDATAISDGGGKVTTLLQPLRGGVEIAHACINFARRPDGETVSERTVNGQPGLVAEQGGVTTAVMAFGFAKDRIKFVWIVLNPEKLKSWRML